MTRVELLEDLTVFCEEAVKGMILPVEVQTGDVKQIEREPGIYKQRLPHSQNANKYAPYIIVQIVDSDHTQKEGDKPRYMVAVRFIHCVYSEDEQVGSIMLLNLMDRVQEKLLKSVQIGKAALLNVHEPLESVIYSVDTAPFFAGEMLGTFYLPGIEREVEDLWQKARMRP